MLHQNSLFHVKVIKNVKNLKSKIFSLTNHTVITALIVNIIIKSCDLRTTKFIFYGFIDVKNVKMSS